MTAVGPPAPQPMPPSEGDVARIVDRGYRRFEGQRLGVSHAMRTVGVHSMQRALGLKRKASAKVLPVIAIAMAFIPAIVFVGISALFKDDVIQENVLPTYPQYYGFVSAAIVIFTAFVSPELLCPDRRSGMLGLYLASPLDRNTYLLAKAAAVGLILSIVTMGPLLLMLIAYTIIGQGPDGIDGWLLTLVRIIAGGLAIAALHTSLSLAIASATTRKAVASAAIVIVLFGTGILTDIAVFGVDGPVSLRLAHLLSLPLETVRVIFGESHADRTDIDQRRLDELRTWSIYAANIGWTVLFSGIVWYRYRRLAVTR
jgi:ABC-2 type transport system permease protein